MKCAASTDAFIPRSVQACVRCSAGEGQVIPRRALRSVFNAPSADGSRTKTASALVVGDQVAGGHGPCFLIGCQQHSAKLFG